MTLGVPGAHVSEIHILRSKMLLSMISHGLEVDEQCVGRIHLKQAFDQSEERRVLLVEIPIVKARTACSFSTSLRSKKRG